ncbi:MAG: DUF192 domain-containing protein, partial [Candidatus Woesearchaeota archaeon]
MKIIDETKDEVLALEVKECKSIWSKAKGLMFGVISQNQGVLLKFNKKNNFFIHGFFVPQTLELIGVRDNEVVEKHTLKPFRAVRIKEKVDYILEILPGKRAEVG